MMSKTDGGECLKGVVVTTLVNKEGPSSHVLNETPCGLETTVKNCGPVQIEQL